MVRPPARRPPESRLGWPASVGDPYSGPVPNDQREGTDARGSLGRSGFESGSDIYERARPTYPEAAVAQLLATTGIVEGSRVLDLAAGTGKLTRHLRAARAACIAAEPSPSMREVFTRTVPGVPMVGATAEAIPLRHDTMDAVVVAQAFHWFDPERALAEMARVLRGPGWLALIWNERDETDPMVAELVRISKWDVCQPYPVGRDFGLDIDASHRFGPVLRTKTEFTQWLDRDAFVEQVATRSYVRVLPDDEQKVLLDQIAAFASTLAEPIAMPYITDLFCAQVAT
jgi:SAM-dependent methyltransferase